MMTRSMTMPALLLGALCALGACSQKPAQTTAPAAVPAAAPATTGNAAQGGGISLDGGDTGSGGKPEGKMGTEGGGIKNP